MKALCFGNVLALTLALTAPLAGQPAGKAVYDKACKTCHGAEGQGNPGLAKSLKATIRHLGSKEVQAKSDEQIKKEVAEGVGKMKPVKLSDADAKAVVAFVRTLKQ